MESFEDLGLGPELVEALASEGMEQPTPFQAAAIPVIRRGNNLMGRAGPGAGTLAAYGAGLLDRLEPGAGTPRALVLVPSTESARQLAEALAPLSAASGHTVASAGSPWVMPERADVLFGTPSELLAWVRANRIDPNAVEAIVVDQASALHRFGGFGDVEALLEFLPKEAQRIVIAMPVTPEVEDFVERYARRAVQVPPAAVEGAADATPKRGEVRYRIVEEPRESGALQLVAELLEDARHACLFFATEDRAADVGDYLTVHGYAAGAPGDGEAPVWLAVGDLSARASLAQEGVVAISFDAPAGPDALDRRHGGGHGGVVVVLPREMPHLRDVARRTGYRVVPFPPPPATAGRGELDLLLARLDAATTDADLGPWLVALEPLFARRGAAEVAAAAVALLRQKAPALPAGGATAGSGAAAAQPTASSTVTRSAPTPRPAPPAAFIRLFVSMGERDGMGPGDLVGAITGESGVAGSHVGKIEIRESFSIVEVQEADAEKVIRALNGVTVRGRSVRADYDRGHSGGREGRGRDAAAPRADKERAPRAKRPSGDREGTERAGGERAPRERGSSERGPRERSGPARGPRERSAPDRGPRERGAGERSGPSRGSDDARGPKRGPGGPGGPKRGPAGPGGPKRGPSGPGGPKRGPGGPGSGDARGPKRGPGGPSGGPKRGPGGPSGGPKRGPGGPRKGPRPPRRDD